mmetsp:Transcript_25331/g.63755  ORF Transcript_25331/g.63755 Transcript_25331/m.63755 type:complete len:144 (+) Transcript_25331:368-799(+)
MNTNASRVDELLRRCSAVSASTRRISSDLKEALEVARPSVEKVAKRVEVMAQLQEQIQRAEAELSNDPDAAAFGRSRQTDWANRFVTWDRLLRSLRSLHTAIILIAPTAGCWRENSPSPPGSCLLIVMLICFQTLFRATHTDY